MLLTPTKTLKVSLSRSQDQKIIVKCTLCVYFVSDAWSSGFSGQISQCVGGDNIPQFSVFCPILQNP